MQLAKSTDLALRILIYAQNNKGSLVTQTEVADFFEISREHVRKIAYELAQNGFLATRRGKGGGFELASEASEINIGEVVQVFETKLPMVDCAGLSCLLTGNCRLKGIIDDARDEFIASLKRYTLEDIVDKSIQRLLLK